MAQTITPETTMAASTGAVTTAPAHQVTVGLDERLRRFVTVKTAADILNDAVKAARTDLTRSLVAEHQESGIKARTVKIGGVKVATATIAEPGPETKVTNEKDLLAWAKTNRPDLIETVEHPATEAWTETRVKAPELTRLIEDSDDTGSGDLVTADGELIPGVRYVATPTPKSFSITFAKPTHKSDDPLAGGRRTVLDAFARGDITMTEALADLDAIAR